MQKITLTVKDDRKLNLLMELLKQFDFIEVNSGKKERNTNYDFFASAGMWKDKDIKSEELRRQAWKKDR